MGIFDKTKMLLFTIFAAISLSLVTAQIDEEGECTPGDVWAEGMIKMTCTHDGVKPTACLPTGKLGEEELQPGQQKSVQNFKYECSSSDEWTMSYDIVACLLPSGEAYAVGTEVGVANKGLYKCIRTSDGKVSRKYTPGCYFNNHLYASGQSWNFGSGQITCVAVNGLFEAKASGCLLPDGKLVELGRCIENGNEYLKCETNGEFAWKAEFTKISEAAYYQWLHESAQEEEESAGGQQQTGQTRRPTTITTTTSTTTTTPEPTEPPTTPEPVTEAPVEPTELPTEEPVEPPVTEEPVEPPVTEEPVEPSTEEPEPPVEPSTEAPVEPSAEPPTEEPAEPTVEPPTEEPAEPSIEPPTEPPVATTPQPKCQDSHPMCEFLCSKSCKDGEPLGFPAVVLSAFSGRHQQGGGSRGRWNRHSREHNSREHGRGRSREHGHGHGHGHGHHGHSHGSHGKNDPTVQPPQPSTVQPSKPPQQDAQCFNLIDAGYYELIYALCPKSCDACDDQFFDWVEIVEKWTTATCTATSQPVPTTALPVPTPSPTQSPTKPQPQPTPRPQPQPQPQPTRPSKGSKGRSKEKGRSREQRRSRERNNSRNGSRGRGRGRN